MDEREALERLVGLLERWSGHAISPADLPAVERLALGRARACGCGCLARYVEFLGGSSGAGERLALVAAFTNKESSLFRGRAQIEALAGTVLPELVRSLEDGGEELVVWSAASARGEEPASLAVALAECRALAGRPWRIVATDVDPGALAAGRRGVFSARSVARVPAPLLERYFVRREEGFALVPGLLARIEFRRMNLVEYPWPFAADTYHVIFLRNVLIYFSVENQRRVAAEAERVLKPGGWLFTGTGESLLHAAVELEPVDLGACVAYRKPVPDGEGGPDRERAMAPASPGRSPGEDPLEAAAAALREEEPEVALAVVVRALEDAPEEPFLHLARGVCHERLGMWEEAVAAYRAVLYLDPSLHHVRLLLARALGRVGWDARARVERRAAMEGLAASTGGPPPAWRLLGLPPVERLLGDGDQG